MRLNSSDLSFQTSSMCWQNTRITGRLLTNGAGFRVRQVMVVGNDQPAASTKPLAERPAQQLVVIIETAHLENRPITIRHHWLSDRVDFFSKQNGPTQEIDRLINRASRFVCYRSGSNGKSVETFPFFPQILFFLNFYIFQRIFQVFLWFNTRLDRLEPVATVHSDF